MLKTTIRAYSTLRNKVTEIYQKLHPQKHKNAKDGRIIGVYFTTGTGSDRGIFKIMNKDIMGIFIADAGNLQASLSGNFLLRTSVRF